MYFVCLTDESVYSAYGYCDPTGSTCSPDQDNPSCSPWVVDSDDQCSPWWNCYPSDP